MRRFYSVFVLAAPICWLNLLAITVEVDVDLDWTLAVLVLWCGAMAILAVPMVLEWFSLKDMDGHLTPPLWSRLIARFALLVALLLLFANPDEMVDAVSSYFSPTTGSGVAGSSSEALSPVVIDPRGSDTFSEPVIVEPITVRVSYWDEIATAVYSLFGLAFAASLWRAYLIVRAWRELPSEARETVWDRLDLPQERRFVAERLHARAQSHKARGGMLLVLIFGLIGLGIGLYFTAGNLVSSDVNRDPLEQTLQLQSRLVSNELRLSSDLNAIERQRAQLFEVFMAIGVSVAERPSTWAEPIVFAADGRCRLDLAVANEMGQRLSEDFVNQVRFSAENPSGLAPCSSFGDLRAALREDIEWHAAYAEATVQLESAREALTGIRTFVSTNMNKLVSPPAPDERFLTQQLLASGLTRFGILFVIIYLVQVLVGIYRYSMRQAEFFESRAASLILAGEQGMEHWRDEFISPQIDFGAPPRSPMHFFERIAGRRSANADDAAGG